MNGVAGRWFAGADGKPERAHGVTIRALGAWAHAGTPFAARVDDPVLRAATSKSGADITWRNHRRVRSPAKSAVRGTIESTSRYSAGEWSLPPIGPRPSRLGTPMPEVVLASEAPPVEVGS